MDEQEREAKGNKWNIIRCQLANPSTSFWSLQIVLVEQVVEIYELRKQD